MPDFISTHGAFLKSVAPTRTTTRSSTTTTTTTRVAIAQAVIRDNKYQQKCILLLELKTVKLGYNSPSLTVRTFQTIVDSQFDLHTAACDGTVIQDSIAIAKKTARCAQYMGALKSFESPHYAPGYFSRNL